MSRLVDGATTLAFRTTEDVDKDEFLRMLGTICPPLWQGNVLPYDFVYLLCRRVIVVNFVFHNLCLNCWTSVHNQIRDGQGYIRKVQQSRYQGLSENLGAFYAKAGWRGLESATAPTVFQGCRQIPLRLAVRMLVPPETLQRLRVAVRGARDTCQVAGPRRPSAQLARRAATRQRSQPKPRQSSAARSAPRADPPTISIPMSAGEQMELRVHDARRETSAVGDTQGMWTAGDRGESQRQQLPLPTPAELPFPAAADPQPCGYNMALGATEARLPDRVSGMVITQRDGVVFFDL